MYCGCRAVKVSMSTVVGSTAIFLYTVLYRGTFKYRVPTTDIEIPNSKQTNRVRLSLEYWFCQQRPVAFEVLEITMLHR